MCLNRSCKSDSEWVLPESTEMLETNREQILTRSVTELKFDFVVRIRFQAKKNSCFWKCGWREKFSPGRPQINFFNRFSIDIRFSSLVSFAFLYSCFFFSCLFVFWNWKYIFWYIFDCAGWWVIIFFSPAWFPETKLLCLASER